MAKTKGKDIPPNIAAPKFTDLGYYRNAILPYRLKSLRKELGLTQVQLARKIKITSQSIINIERQISATPQKRTLCLLAFGLGVTSDYLVGQEYDGYQAWVKNGVVYYYPSKQTFYSHMSISKEDGTRKGQSQKNFEDYEVEE